MRRSQRLLRVAVPLSRFAVLMRRGSASYVRHRGHGYWFMSFCSLTIADTGFPSLQPSTRQKELRSVSSSRRRCAASAIAAFATPSPDWISRASTSIALASVSVFVFILFRFYALMPNKSPEPTAVGACSSAIAVHAASRRG